VRLERLWETYYARYIIVDLVFRDMGYFNPPFLFIREQHLLWPTHD
jgi:hypothetical protein